MVSELLLQMLHTAFSLLNGAAVWLVMSYLLAGVMRVFLSPDKMQRMLGNGGWGAVVKATLSGMLLPICSCGVIPLGIGLYYSGAYLGPTLAFMAATPILNPAALLLTYGFLGPQITMAYVVTGILVSLLIGAAGNRMAGEELFVPGAEEGRVMLEEGQSVSLLERLRAEVTWGVTEMGAVVSKYVVFGMIVVAVILTVVPPSYIDAYLGAPGLLSVLGIAVLAFVMYVCAVGHIPFVAVLIASGAAPGLAVTFLMVGAASNLPELISIYKLIGRRAVAIYFSVVTGVAIVAGYVTNLILMPGFMPQFSLDKTRHVVDFANNMLFSAPDPVKYLCSALVAGLAVQSVWPSVRRAFLLGMKS